MIFAWFAQVIDDKHVHWNKIHKQRILDIGDALVTLKEEVVNPNPTKTGVVKRLMKPKQSAESLNVNYIR